MNRNKRMKRNKHGQRYSVLERTLKLLAVASLFSSVPETNSFVSDKRISLNSLRVFLPAVNNDSRFPRGRAALASVTTDTVFTSDAADERIDALKSPSKIRGPPSLGKEGLSLGLGREGTAATAQLLVNGTTVEHSTASFDRFQWIDDEERLELHQRYAMVSLELIAEVNIKKPGYVNILPSSGAGSTAALRRVVEKSTAWNRYTGTSAIFDEIDGNRVNKDRLWVTGFSLTSQRGYLHSVDAETGHIDSVNKQTSSSILWPNESSSVPSFREMRVKSNGSAAINSKGNERDDALLVSDGFLVPGKNKGGIYVVKNPGNSGTEWTCCLTGGSTKHRAWFYHRCDFLLQ